MRIRSARVHNIALGIDSQLVLHAANAARFGDVPDLAEGFLVRCRRYFHLELFEAVFAAILTGVGAGNSFGPLLGYFLQVSFRGSSVAWGLVSDALCPGTPARFTSSLRPPMAPMTPAASAGRKIVVFLP